MAPPKDHECAWQEYAGELAAKLEAVQQRLEQLEKQTLGKRSEKRKTGKMPPPVAPVPAARRTGDALRDAVLDTEVTPVPVPPDQACCPKCDNTELRRVGSGKSSTVYEYVAGHFRRRVFMRETLSCTCGNYVVTAPAPERVGDKTQYSASFIAHLVVTKCADCRAQYNLAKEYQRIGIPISRSTINTLFHRAGSLLDPLVERLFARIAQGDVVLADETSMRMQGTEKKAFVWAFLSARLIGYRFSCDRSGDTPMAVLGNTSGYLVCDAYTGYNKLTSTGGRRRAGCLAHARRKVFEASEHPEAAAALDLFGEIYLVEREAKNAGLAATEAHARMRKERSRAPFAKLLCWARQQRRDHGPKSRLGRAARYIINNFRELGVFLREPRVPPDNNRSESALRRVALGRRVFLFVGNEDAGKRLAGLYSLVASCELNGVSPVAYLTDVLTRIDRHPMARIDELLPDAWHPP